MSPSTGTLKAKMLKKCYITVLSPWASAHRGKRGQLTPLEKWMKN